MSKGKKSKFKAFIIILAVMVFIIGAAAYLALWNETPAAAENKSFDVIDNIRTLQANGGKLELTEDEINSTIRTLFEKPVEKGGVTISGAFVNISSKAITLFAPIKYKGINLLPNITGNIDYVNDRLIYKITSFKIGKLRLPKSIILNRLKSYSNEDVVIDGDKIEISKYLFPFNAEKIYLSDYKIIADIAKMPTLQNIIGSEGKSNSSKQPNQTGGTAAGKSTNNNSSSSTKTPSTVKPPPSQVAALNKVSNQLNSVIADVKTAKEKQMIEKIQTVVNEVAKDPNYSYQSQANEVKAWYSTLQPDEKSRVQKAIISNVNVMDILKLINIFGI